MILSFRLKADSKKLIVKTGSRIHADVWREIVLNYLGISSSPLTNSLTLSLEGTGQEAETVSREGTGHEDVWSRLSEVGIDQEEDLKALFLKPEHGLFMIVFRGVVYTAFSTLWVFLVGPSGDSKERDQNNMAHPSY